MNETESSRRVIDGRFELEARLGGGGMGMVWRARDLVLDRAVALKEVRPPDPGFAEYDPQGAAVLRARVLREARALARADHPNVVTIHHVVDGGEDGYPWLVMELVTGGSLQDRLDRGPLAPVEAAQVGREVLAALRTAHAVGIQHRDVKPANVLMRPDGRPVLTDFGIAAIRESTALTVTGSVIGTPDYMAPERISGGEGGPGSDLWSLAMMLYVAVEGHHPLRKGSTLATLAALLSEELPPPLQAGPLSAFLNAVLVKDPAGRADVETADQLLAAAAEGRGAAPGTPLGTPGTTSYRLASPPPTPVPSAPAGSGQSSGFGPPTGFGQPSVHDAVPGPFPTPGPFSVGPPRQTPARPGGRAKSRLMIALSVLGTVLAGVLMWTLLPDGGDQGRKSAADSHPSSSTPAKDASTPLPRVSRSESVQEADARNDLLTPEGIRTAVEEIKAATGTDRACDFTVYADYVSAEIMVKGSDTKYDSYTYRPGQGVEKGIISSTLIGGERPFDLDAFDWGVLPPLLERAERELNVKQPTMRYVMVRPTDTTFGTPMGLAVYLADDYVTGYLDADLEGKVTRVMPATD
ncbi:serine/threonine protein kinase [Streptomyces sp. CB02009]|uniref:serine/threonine-protein kinase n=1 Tax=Streptomyces sp. CB02009 TaxID=1703938 RepID=UPI00093E836D|nr:serine/threonine-protein kinase [Streptomyces sp. CB02009]OKJ49481.1 serine/threonine protein kinase [Streptomyces sp. CB02009]